MGLTVDSFILKDKNIIISSLDNSNEDYFINIKNFTLLNKKKLDYDYLEGAICISYNNQELVGFNGYDLVEQLWDYFVDAIDRLRVNPDVEFQFPDQPFVVKLERKNIDFLILNLNEKKYNVNFKEFSSIMLDSAILFYKNLILLFPEHSSFIEESLNKAEQVRKEYELEIFYKRQ